MAQEAVSADSWWAAAVTRFNVWELSWTVPRLVCGIRFMRLPRGELIDGGLRLSIRDGEVGSTFEGGGLHWHLDGALFQQRAIEFYEGQGPPPMGDAWLLHLLESVPATADIVSGASLIDASCSALHLLASYLHAEYLMYLMPPEVFSPMFQRMFIIHQKSGLTREDEALPQLVGLLRRWHPMAAALSRMETALAKQAELSQAAELRQQPLLLDIVVARCREDVGWLATRLRRVLYDEWTLSTPGLRVRLLLVERCESPSSLRPLLLEAVRIGALAPGSRTIELREPPGFEHVAYVYYLASGRWRSADFSMFLHAAPFSHLDVGTLDDVLRSLALGTYDVPFVHLNVKRVPAEETRGCTADLLNPALAAWPDAGAGSQEPGDVQTPSGSDADGKPSRASRQQSRALPSHLVSYCCSQFVVARERLEQVPSAFWRSIWRSIAGRRGAANASEGETPSSCAGAARRVRYTHGEGASPVHGLWAITLELAWHWIFGEEALLPTRERDPRLPLFLRVPRARTADEGGPRGALHDRVEVPDWGFDPGWWGTSRLLPDWPGTNLTPASGGSPETVPSVAAVPTAEASEPHWKQRAPAHVKAWAARWAELWESAR
eukprot:TRINITY_DN63483_c0_g1_i1.p1 TRINITY_DN63483_c0_g1~~TRINITY_DN63483_c0_g1_i1.p1  ORF type:complete len:704 (-),score=111.35 TRINITY_DN63483_c0_g1_i1:20-1843(-)